MLFRLAWRGSCLYNSRLPEPASGRFPAPRPRFCVTWIWPGAHRSPREPEREPPEAPPPIPG
ncbi:carbamoyl-phosphate synthase small subunit, partial [Xanthomonas perforans]